ncbi:MAG: hypothetical protein AAF004_02990 [Pseudomonadota bacterium]
MANRSIDITRSTHQAPAAQAFENIWVPRALYEAIPYFYVLGGIAALFAALYINSSAWVVPQWILFAAICLHIGVRIFWMRLKARRSTLGIDIFDAPTTTPEKE